MRLGRRRLHQRPRLGHHHTGSQAPDQAERHEGRERARPRHGREHAGPEEEGEHDGPARTPQGPQANLNEGRPDGAAPETQAHEGELGRAPTVDIAHDQRQDHEEGAHVEHAHRQVRDQHGDQDRRLGGGLQPIAHGAQPALGRGPGDRGRRGQPQRRDAPERQHRRLQEQERGRPDRAGAAPHPDPRELRRELGGGHHRHRAPEPTRRHARQHRVARWHDEGARGADRERVGDQAAVGQPAPRDDHAQQEGWQGGHEMPPHQQPAAIRAVGDRPAKQHQEDRRRHERHLGDADPRGRLVKHHGDEPREHDGLHPGAREPRADPGQVPGKGAGGGRHRRVRPAACGCRSRRRGCGAPGSGWRSRAAAPAARR